MAKTKNTTDGFGRIVKLEALERKAFPSAELKFTDIVTEKTIGGVNSSKFNLLSNAVIIQGNNSIRKRQIPGTI